MLAALESAVDMLKRIQRDELAPAFRSMGLKGSGKSFRLPSESHWALIGLQGDRWNDRERAGFTINLAVVGHAVWEEMRELMTLPKQPTPTMRWPLPYWHTRIGHLMPAERDTWWEVRAGQSAAGVVREVIDVVRTIAIPALREQIAAETTNPPGPILAGVRSPGINVARELVEQLAMRVGEPARETLERGLDARRAVIALTVEERDQILDSLGDCPEGLERLKDLLQKQRDWRARQSHV